MAVDNLQKGVYLEFPPPEHLSSFIEACWFYQPNFSGPKWDILIPEGVVDVIFNLGAPYFRKPVSLEADEGVWIADDVIVGQRTQLFSIRWPMHTRLFAIRIKPEAAQYLISGSVKNLTNTAQAIVSGHLAELSKLAHGDFTDCEKLANCCFQVLSDYFANQPPCDPRLSNAIHIIRDRLGNIEVQSLCSELGINRRALERVFSEKVGLSPKFFAQTLRLHHFLCTHLPQSSDSLTASAMDAQYYDQSHFIKEFKRFTGQSPAAFFKAPPEIYQPLLVSLLGRVQRC